MPNEYTLIGGNGTRVSPLEVTESGTYEAGDSRAFNPVKVNVPSGSSTLVGLTDVDISNPSDGQTLVYNATSGKWENGSGGIFLISGTPGDGGVVLNKTYNEIKNAYLAGLTCVINRVGDYSEPTSVEIYTVYSQVLSITEEEIGEPGATTTSYLVDAWGQSYTTDTPTGYPSEENNTP